MDQAGSIKHHGKAELWTQCSLVIVASLYAYFCYHIIYELLQCQGHQLFIQR